MAKKRSGTMTPSTKSCADLSLERLEFFFDTFDQHAVAFSGGKDSTACLNLALEVARDKKKLPLRVYTFDEEAIPPETVEYMERIFQNDEIDFTWLCVPVEHRNACSRTQPYWHPWADEDKALWVRDLPSQATTDFKGFTRSSPEEAMEKLFSPKNGTLCNIMGIRCQESMTRFRSVAARRGFNACHVRTPCKWITKGYPIYDWKTEDVWVAPAVYGWDYNKAYDVMEACGIPRLQARCSPPFGEQPLRRLHTYKTCWPELWDKMTRRVHGAATAARYANTDLYGMGVKDSHLPEGKTWRQFVLQTMDTLDDKSRASVAHCINQCFTIHRNLAGVKAPIPDAVPHHVSGFCWKQMYRVARAGGDKLGRQFQTINSSARQERLKEREQKRIAASS